MGTTAQEILAAAQSRLAMKGGKLIGTLVSWDAEPVDVSREDARGWLRIIGLEHLVKSMAPETALTRSAGEGRKPEGFLVRAFEVPKGTAAAIGIYRVTGSGESGDGFDCQARVRVEGGACLALPPEGKSYGTDEAMSWAQDIARRANRLLTHAAGKDISKVLVDVAAALSGVPLRKRGGFYLLPTATSSQWDAIAPGLEQIGFAPISIPMHDDPGSIRAAAQAAQGALEGDIRDLEEALAKMASKGMREQSATDRANLCDVLTAKAELYRDVLASKADQIGSHLAKLHAAFEFYANGGAGEPPAFTPPAPVSSSRAVAPISERPAPSSRPAIVAAPEAPPAKPAAPAEDDWMIAAVD